MTIFLGLFALLLGTPATFAQEASPLSMGDKQVSSNHVIDVWAKRPETVRPHRAGQSVVIRPEDETRFDTRIHLRQEANLTLPDTGRTTASGFTLPRVRGQDSRFTEVYLEDMKVQDPYGGISILDDLDLRALGELHIYVGNPPPSLPTISPNGALAYKMHTPFGLKHQFGALTGRPFGHAVWGLSQYKSPDKNEMRLYLRQHSTNGEFPFHDDRATPYNTADDRTSLRVNGDRRALQALPNFAWQSGHHRVSGLGLLNHANTGLPSRNSDTLSVAREDSVYRIGKLSYNYAWHNQATILPDFLGVELGRYDLDTTTTDPTRVVVGPIESTRRQLDAHTGAGYLKWLLPTDDGDSTIVLRMETTDSKIHTTTSASSDFTVRRHQGMIYSGIDLALPEDLHLEAKGMATRQQDATKGEQTPDTRDIIAIDSDLILPGSSAGLAWQPENLTLYGQIARLKRPPTLLEKYGDGGMIRNNPGLSPETTLHRELGFQWRDSPDPKVTSPLKRYQIRAAIFRDDTRDRIILLPSLAQTMRAQNAMETDVSGAEIATEITVWQTTLTAGYARLSPWDRSYKQRSRLIPGVAEHVGTASLSQALPWATIRLGSRYQSQVWRDSENSIAIPGYLIHDMTVDSAWKSLAFGLAVYNLSDQKRLPIYARDTSASRGETSYSDYAGMPLPGRNWRLSMSASF